MGRRDIELRDAVNDAMAAARVTRGQMRQLMPVYANRLGLAYQVALGRQIHRTGRTIAITAVVAALTGAAAAIAAERFFGHRTVPEPVTEEADTETPVRQDATFTG